MLEDCEGPFLFLAWGGQVDSEERDEMRRGLFAPSSPLPLPQSCAAIPRHKDPDPSHRHLHGLILL